MNLRKRTTINKRVLINNEQGYILLLSVLVSSIILAISLGVYALSIKELVLASFLKDSARAFGAADRAMECTLYWDRSYPQNGMPYSIFATSTDYVVPTNINLATCEGVQLNTMWTIPLGLLTPTTGTTQLVFTYTENNTCAEVNILKEGGTRTTIVSNGYSSCDVNNPRRTQRTIQVTGEY